jgi:CubicO group peptidase (beta-lactamase class C family)
MIRISGYKRGSAPAPALQEETAERAEIAKKNCLRVLGVLCGFFLNGVIAMHAQAPVNPALAGAFAEVDRLFMQFMTDRHVPGAAWGVIIDGQLAHVGVNGQRDLAAKAPVDADTVFRIASMTKSFATRASCRSTIRRRSTCRRWRR